MFSINGRNNDGILTIHYRTPKPPKSPREILTCHPRHLCILENRKSRPDRRRRRQPPFDWLAVCANLLGSFFCFRWTDRTCITNNSHRRCCAVLATQRSAHPSSLIKSDISCVDLRSPAQPSSSPTMVTGENTELKQSASSSSDPKPTATASGGICCYWPEQSCGSLPPLPGKVAAGLVGGRGMEFSVNEECELCLGYIHVTAARFCAAILFESSSPQEALCCIAIYVILAV